MKDARRASVAGTWRLAAWTGVGEDGTVVDPLGSGGHGLLILTEDGFFSVQISIGDRAHCASESLFLAADDELADMARTYLAYAGSYEVVDDRIALSAGVSLFPNWVGTRQERDLAFEGDTMVLRPPPQQMADGPYRFELRWHRARDEVVDSMGGG